MQVGSDHVEIYEEKPKDFVNQIQVAACYLEVDNKLLLLKTSFGKSEPGKWGVPAGKLENQEHPKDAAKRELFEETGILLEAEDNITHLQSLYVRKPEMDYVYHMFKVKVDRMLDVQLSKEHVDYQWTKLEELEQLPLMKGAKESLEKYRKMTRKPRKGSIVSVYLLLKKENKILLHLRKNTGYCDGKWGIVAGHVEDGESATHAMVREAREEIGIELCASQLEVVHVMHRQTDRLNIDIFFNCVSWQGTIQNCEPHKCEGLKFFDLEALPPNMMEYNLGVIQAIHNGKFYSEGGWGSDF